MPHLSRKCTANEKNDEFNINFDYQFLSAKDGSSASSVEIIDCVYNELSRLISKKSKHRLGNDLLRT